MDASILRALERILAVGIGGLSIYLGFRLFLSIPQQIHSDGRITMPGGISVHLTKTGPGAFFALFGAIVVSLSFRYSITYSESDSNQANKAGVVASRSGREYIGLSGVEAGGEMESLKGARIQLRANIEYLNGSLPSILKPDLSKQQIAEYENSLAESKLAMMKSVWAPDWGQFDAFKQWVQAGTFGAAPKDLSEAGQFYKSGERKQR